MGFSRSEWIKETNFAPEEDGAALRLLSKKIEEAKDARPVVVLDLDSTLYYVEPRTYQIIKEWLASSESRKFRNVAEELYDLELTQVGYSMKDTFLNMNLSLQEEENKKAHDSIKKFWLERFFHGKYLEYDLVEEGTVDWVKKWYELGAEIIYLTGRDEPGMGQGTYSRLERDGFPLDKERAYLAMKDHCQTEDVEHKSKYCQKLFGKNVVALFENEPGNLVTLSKIHPDAMAIFVDTFCSERPAEPGETNFYKVKSFADKP